MIPFTPGGGLRGGCRRPATVWVRLAPDEFEAPCVSRDHRGSLQFGTMESDRSLEAGHASESSPLKGSLVTFQPPFVQLTYLSFLPRSQRPLSFANPDQPEPAQCANGPPGLTNYPGDRRRVAIQSGWRRTR